MQEETVIQLKLKDNKKELFLYTCSYCKRKYEEPFVIHIVNKHNEDYCCIAKYKFFSSNKEKVECLCKFCLFAELVLEKRLTKETVTEIKEELGTIKGWLFYSAFYSKIGYDVKSLLDNRKEFYEDLDILLSTSYKSK